MIASGVLPVGETKFDIDFAAVLSIYGAAENDTPDAGAVENKGNDFDTVSGMSLAKQAQRVLFIRTLLYDEDDEVVGVTGSGMQVVYGRPSLDLSPPAQIGFESEYEPPVLSAKTIPGFATSSYEEIPDKGLYIFKSDLFDKGFSVEGIPGDSVETYFQIADRPFKNSYTVGLQAAGRACLPDSGAGAHIYDHNEILQRPHLRTLPRSLQA